MHITSGQNRDYVVGGSGSNLIEGHSGADLIFGGSGNNQIFAENVFIFGVNTVANDFMERMSA